MPDSHDTDDIEKVAGSQVKVTMTIKWPTISIKIVNSTAPEKPQDDHRKVTVALP